MVEYIKLALRSILSNKARMLLTVLGVMIGVWSVTLLVAMGEGLKRDVAKSISGFGTNVIAVIGGKIDTASPGRSATNPANFISGDILTLEDLATISRTDGIKGAAPISLLPGSLKAGDKVANPTIFGTTPNFLDVVAIVKLESGRMFNTDSTNGGIVISKNAKVALFGDSDPIGQTVNLGDDLTVVGVLGKSKSAGLFGSEFDNLTLIPLARATALNKNQTKIMRIVAVADDQTDIAQMKETIKAALIANHHGEENFSILTQDDLLGLFNQFLSLATTLVSSIAAVSLIVGGIGIMNIMLATVTERTREIGLRKAVGATKTAIAWQFLIEAVMITFLGALLGLGMAFLVGLIVASKTELKPYFSLATLVLATGISVAVGLIFGLWPALRAANKDPVEALRYE